MGDKKKSKVGVITKQPIRPEKLARARQLRREMTPAERRLWDHIRNNQLGGWHFRRQQIIDGFIIDFYCHRAGLIVEVDGPIHDQLSTADTERETILQARGLRIRRFENRALFEDLPGVLRQLLAELEDGASLRDTPQPPS